MQKTKNKAVNRHNTRLGICGFGNKDGGIVISNCIFKAGCLRNNVLQRLPILPAASKAPCLKNTGERIMTIKQLELPKQFHKLRQKQNVKYDLGKIAISFGGGHSKPDSTESFLNWLFFYAKKLSVSDIHFQDKENGCLIRFRQQDMTVTNFELISRQHGNEIDNLLRAYGKLSDTDKRRGVTTSLYLLNQETEELLNIRLNFIPTQFGQNIVCRLLGQAEDLSLDQIDLPEYLKEPYIKAITSESGFIATSGPTGSGKTRTIATSINHINDGTRIIHTVEDPPEINIPGTNQIAVSPQLGFRDAQKNFLRQDPDVILVGELRDDDFESAQAALHLANTGHLVFTTLHAPDAAKTIMRFIQLGCEPYVLANTLTCFFSQRLMRRLCPHCALVVPVPQDTELPTRESYPFYHRHNPEGCSHCNYTGLNGRIPIFEMGFNTSEVRQGILKMDLEKITEALFKQSSYRTLVEAALERSAQGLIDFDEALSMVGIQTD